MVSTASRLGSSSARTGAVVFLALLAVWCLGASPAARADANTFTLLQPLNGATVRETVPIVVPHALLSQSAYATITIDGHFRGAPAVPTDSDTIWRWATKEPFKTGGDEEAAQTTPDGQHTIVVALFDKDSNEVAEATTTVKVANMITSLPDGVVLAYKWRQDEILGYTVYGTLKRAGDDAAPPVDNGGYPGAPTMQNAPDNAMIQSVDARFDRSVEDMEPGDILLRDHVESNGVVMGGSAMTAAFTMGPNGPMGGGAGGGVGTPVQQMYQIASKYWTVDRFGKLLADNKPISSGDHLGFPIEQLPPRRVNVGDSWQTDIMASLQWSSGHMAILHGQAKLDSFEWQNGYPTAKIVETYSGPAKFDLSANGSDLPPINANSVNLTRTVWFAYEAGMVVRSVTSMTSDCQVGSDQLSALGGGLSTAGGPQYGGPPGMYGGGPPNGPPEGMGMPPYMMRNFRGRGGPFGAYGAAGPEGVPDTAGAPAVQPNPLEQQRAQQEQLTPIKLRTDETINLASVGSS